MSQSASQKLGGSGYVRLATLSGQLTQGPGGRTAFATALGVLLLTYVFLDCLLTAVSVSPLTGLLTHFFEAHNMAKASPFAILAIQLILFTAGARTIEGSALGAIVDFGLLPVATFGEDYAGRFQWSLGVRYAVYAGLAIALFLVVGNVAPLPDHGNKGAYWLDKFLLWLLPMVGAWIYTTLIFRVKIDRSVLIGLALALVTIVVMGAAIDSANEDARGVGFNPFEIVWFRLVELVMAWAVMGSWMVTMLSNPMNQRVFKLVGDGVEQADLCIDYSPFHSSERSPKRLMFELGRAKLIALTRRFQSDTYEVVNTTDDHVQVPLHDRSLKIWNITGLLGALPNTFHVTDPGGYFEMSVTLGQLSTITSVNVGRKEISRSSVDLATEVIFNNSDLVGLLTRAARDALEAQVKGIVGIIDSTGRLATTAPSALSSPMEASSQSELELWMGRHEAFKRHGSKFDSEAATARQAADEAIKRACDWKVFPAGAAAATPEQTLEDEWFNRIIAQFAPSDRDHTDVGGAKVSIDYSEARFVLRAIGLRFNEVRISPSQRTAVAYNGLLEARRTIAGHLERYEELHREAMIRYEKLRETVVKGVIDKTTGFSSRTTAQVISSVLPSTRPLGHAAQPPQPTIEDEVEGAIEDAGPGSDAASVPAAPPATDDANPV